MALDEGIAKEYIDTYGLRKHSKNCSSIKLYNTFSGVELLTLDITGLVAIAIP
jgi:hypothetical protein